MNTPYLSPIHLYHMHDNIISLRQNNKRKPLKKNDIEYRYQRYMSYWLNIWEMVQQRDTETASHHHNFVVCLCLQTTHKVTENILAAGTNIRFNYLENSLNFTNALILFVIWSQDYNWQLVTTVIPRKCQSYFAATFIFRLVDEIFIFYSLTIFSYVGIFTINIFLKTTKPFKCTHFKAKNHA